MLADLSYSIEQPHKRALRSALVSNSEPISPLILSFGVAVLARRCGAY